MINQVDNNLALVIHRLLIGSVVIMFAKRALDMLASFGKQSADEWG